MLPPRRLVGRGVTVEHFDALGQTRADHENIIPNVAPQATAVMGPITR